MKKLSVIVILIASITFTAEAQHRPMKRKPNFTTEQKVELAVKKMTLALDLTAKQQKEVRFNFLQIPNLSLCYFYHFVM